MGQISNILDGRIVPASMAAPRALPQSTLARLIPGAENTFRQEFETNRRDWLKSDDLSLGCASLFTSLLLVAALLYLHVEVPPLLLLVVPLLSCVFTVFGRKTMRVLAAERSNRRNTLAVGSGALAMQTLGEMRGSHDSGRCVKQVISGAQLNQLCECGEFATYAREHFLDEILIVSQDVDLPTVMKAARRQRLDVTVAIAGAEDSVRGRITVECVGRTKLIGVRREDLPLIQLSAKRAADVLLSAFALVALLPMLSVIAALVAIDSEGPVLYRSQRVGTKGRRFRCYKFRTMAANADADKEQLRNRNERTGAFFKISDDPRITRIGKFLRRYSLDEVPQLWNVLRGDMSLVGPRPHPPDDLERYGTQHLRRLDFVPGITGLWQVTARHDPSFERSVALDVEYIRNWSLWLDLRILFRTVGAVVRGSGV